MTTHNLAIGLPADPSRGLCVIARTASVKTSIRAVGGSSGPANDAMAASVPVHKRHFSYYPESTRDLLPKEKAPLPSAFGNGPIWISIGRMSVALRPSLRMYVDEEFIFDMSIGRTIRQEEQDTVRICFKEHRQTEISGVHSC